MSRIPPNRTGYNGFTGYECIGITPVVIPPIDCNGPNYYKRLPELMRGGVSDRVWENLSPVDSDPRLRGYVAACGLDFDPFLGTTVVDLYQSFLDNGLGPVIETGCPDEYGTGYMNPFRSIDLDGCRELPPAPSDESSSSSSSSMSESSSSEPATRYCVAQWGALCDGCDWLVFFVGLTCPSVPPAPLDEWIEITPGVEYTYYSLTGDVCLSDDNCTTIPPDPAPPEVPCYVAGTCYYYFYGEWSCYGGWGRWPYWPADWIECRESCSASGWIGGGSPSTDPYGDCYCTYSTEVCGDEGACNLCDWTCLPDPVPANPIGDLPCLCDECPEPGACCFDGGWCDDTLTESQCYEYGGIAFYAGAACAGEGGDVCPY